MKAPRSFLWLAVICVGSAAAVLAQRPSWKDFLSPPHSEAESVLYTAASEQAVQTIGQEAAFGC